ncbi:mechanosensitive ion channel family protein [Reinekea sp.]|jgi:small conductance mechanosensitive channel|uniref:mechanosensitive ion channel family protein n=1 Tax=Reinekea sp. TaxID=1970455 RepID=UPI003989EE53
MNQFTANLLTIVPVSLTFILATLTIFAVRSILSRKWESQPNLSFQLPLIILGLIILSLLAIILALPVSDTLRSQLLSLFGIVISAAIALSSTTFIGNILAGIMLRIIKSARPGDFITIDEITGRITEMGLLHTEIQTEDRDLVTLPNTSMVTQAIKVVRSSGTIISAEVSLGYDISRITIQSCLLRAAEKAGLQNGFVQVRELGDYSVLYRVAGLKEEVKGLISARSSLREQILDELHAEGIEIVSPTFMNTRVLDANAPIIPKKIFDNQLKEASQQEDLAFDKAEEAATLEELKGVLSETEVAIQELDDSNDDNKDEQQIHLRSKREDLIKRIETDALKLKED